MYRRIEIIKDVETSLQNITVAKGYVSEVGTKVTRRFKHYSKVNEFPFINVISGTGTIKPGGYNHNATGYEQKFSYGIIGYVKTDKDIEGIGLLSDALENLMGDVIKCLTADVARSQAYVMSTDPVSINPYMDWGANIGICEIMFESDFHLLNTEP